MPTLPTRMLKPGMVLAQDMRNDMGRHLLSKGTCLSERHLRVLRIWGVFEADVEGDQDESQLRDPEPDPLILEAARSEMQPRFAANDLEYPLIKEVFRISVLRRATDLAAGQPVVAIPASPEPENPRLPQRRDLSPSSLVSDGVRLNTIPSILSELMEIVNSPRSSSLDIARVVEKDTSLTAKLLKIVNSPFYGFPSKIETITRAVTIVGTKQLTTLAVGVIAIDAFKGIPEELYDMEAFWRHSLYAAFLARVLAGYTTTSNSERFFVAGLLHDVGRLILYHACPQEAGTMLLAGRKLKKPTHILERKIFGFDHAQVGAELLKRWNFPKSLENAVRHHYRPSDNGSYMESGLVHLADVCASALTREKYVDYVIPRFDRSVWEELGLPVVSIATVISQTDYLFDQTAGMFF